MGHRLQHTLRLEENLSVSTNEIASEMSTRHGKKKNAWRKNGLSLSQNTIF